MRTYLQNCMKLCFKKFDIFSGPNKALCWSRYFKRTSKWSSCRWGKAINSYLTLIEHHSSHADIQLHLIFQEIETAEPQENSSHKTLGHFVYTIQSFQYHYNKNHHWGFKLVQKIWVSFLRRVDKKCRHKMRQGKVQAFPVYNDDSLTSMNRQSSSIAATSYAMITKRHKLKLII